MTDKIQKLDNILENGYRFDMSRFIGEAFRLFKMNAGLYLGYTLLFFLIFFAASSIPYIGQGVNSLLVTPALILGYYIAAHHAQSGQEVTMDTYFKGFSYWRELMVAAFVISLITAFCYIPMAIDLHMKGAFGWFDELKNMTPDDMSFDDIPWPTWGLISLLPLIFVSVALSWTYHFIYFYKMNFWTAIQYSVKFITKKWFHFLGLNIILGLMMMGGLLFFIIGIVAVMPIAVITSYTAFSEITQLQTAAEESEGSDGLV